MQKLPSVLEGFALVWSANTHAQSAANGVEYRLGGVVSGPLEVSVDFDSGDAAVSRPIGHGDWTMKTVHSTLTNASRALLKAEAEKAAEAGLESKSCMDEAKPGQIRPPNMDAMLDLIIRLDGKVYGAPVQGSCWSNAANAFFRILGREVKL